MKKITLLFLLVVFKMSAQDTKVSVAVMPFQSSISSNSARAAQLQEIVLEVLSLKTNIEPIDRSKDLLLNKELDIQINERSIASKKLVEQGKKIGANQLIIGTLTSLEVGKNNGSSGLLDGIINDNTAAFKANISFSLQIIDVETGKIISHKSFNKSKDKIGLIILGTGSSEESAIVSAMEDCKKKILSWLNEVYPSLIKIVKIEERKNGKPKTILITGIDNSLNVGSKLSLEETEIIDGGNNESLNRIRKIATLVIKEKQGDITVCKITDGEEVIEEKMSNGSKLSIKAQ